MSSLVCLTSIVFMSNVTSDKCVAKICNVA